MDIEVTNGYSQNYDNEFVPYSAAHNHAANMECLLHGLCSTLYGANAYEVEMSTKMYMFIDCSYFLQRTILNSSPFY